MKEKTTNIAIKYWNEDDRPREKLLFKGSEFLSNAELLAIIIGSGSRNDSAVQLSKRILNSVNNDLVRLSTLSIPQLMTFKGIGEAKAVSISAAMELVKRKMESTSGDVKRIMASKDVFDLMFPVLGDLPHEEFWVIFLNNANRIIAKRQLSKGGITGALVDLRIILKQALELHAVHMIVVHNHPSGNNKPSEADKGITQKLMTAASNLDIKVLDHVIIAEKTYFSFADDGLL